MGNMHQLSPRKADSKACRHAAAAKQTNSDPSSPAGPVPGMGKANGNVNCSALAKQKSLSSAEESASTGYSLPNTPSQHSIRLKFDTPDQEAIVGFYTLNVFQKKLLKQKWQNVNKTGGGGLGSLVFQKLLAKQPQLREMFQKAEIVEVFNKETTCNSLAAHIKLFVDLLDEAINSVDDLDAIGEKCVQYGEVHCCLHGLGFEANLWDIFGQAFIDVITGLDAIRRHRELVRAWRVLASFIVDRIRQGYEDGVRRKGLVRQASTFSVPDSSQAYDNDEKSGIEQH